MPALTTAANLTRLRSRVADSFDQTAQVQRATAALVSDGMGGNSPGAPTTIGTYACRVGPGQSPILMVQGGAVVSQDTFKVVLPNTAVVAAGDLIVVGTHTYRVLGLLSGPSWNIDTAVRCVEVL